MEFKTKGTCTSKINYAIRDGKVYDVVFTNGCSGNLKGIANLVNGMSVDDVIKRLKGINCGFKNTSCPDQLARALEGEKIDRNK